MSAARLAAMGAVLLLATGARAEEMLFPPATASCHAGTELSEAPPGAKAARKGTAPAVTAVRLQRGFPQLMLEETGEPQRQGQRLVNLRVIVTFADAGRNGTAKRYANGLFEMLSCSADVCDAGNYRVERQADGSVLLKMTGGLNVGAGEGTSRRLADGSVYRLSPKDTCK